MTQIERLQTIRHLVWDLYTNPSFEKEETLTHLCDEAIDIEIHRLGYSSKDKEAR